MRLEAKVRASLARAAAQISSEDRWNDIQSAPPLPVAASSPRRRLLIGAVALAVFAAAALFVWTAFRPGTVRPTSKDGRYKIFIADWKQEKDPRIVVVTAQVAWASSVFPGARDCRFEVHDASGDVIGSNHQMFQETEPRSDGVLLIEVEINGTPQSVRTSCGSRLDVGSPYAYAITNVHVSVQDGSPSLHFYASWEGPSVPGVVWCRYALLERNGTPVATREATLSFASTPPSLVGQGYPTDVRFHSSDVHGSTGADTAGLTPVIDCVPYLGGGESLPPLPDPGSFSPPTPSPLPTNEQSRDSGYAFTDVTTRPENDHWIVEWKLRWATDRFPGQRRCEWTIYDADGVRVAYQAEEFEILSPSTDGSWVTDQQPARFEGSCGSRLDVPVAYIISDPHLNEGAVAFHMEWPAELADGTSPGTNQCVIAVLDPNGNVLAAQPFTLSAPPGDYSQEVGRTQSASAASALVKCEPYTGDASPILSTLNTQPGSGSYRSGLDDVVL